MEFLHWWRSSDAVIQIAALVLLLMSVASWVMMLWKVRLLARASGDIARSLAAFWNAPDLAAARASVASFDASRLTLPMVDAAASVSVGVDTSEAKASAVTKQPTASRIGTQPVHAMRLLRGALGQAVARLQYGQVVLATVGATSPFVGLLGTVWGIHQALAALAGSGQVSVERLAGPVGEALIMTAAGLAVAIPAVLGYNVLGRRVAALEAELEGFAHDLLALCTGAPQA